MGALKAASVCVGPCSDGLRYLYYRRGLLEYWKIANIIYYTAIKLLQQRIEVRAVLNRVYSLLLPPNYIAYHPNVTLSNSTDTLKKPWQETWKSASHETLKRLWCLNSCNNKCLPRTNVCVPICSLSRYLSDDKSDCRGSSYLAFSGPIFLR